MSQADWPKRISLGLALLLMVIAAAALAGWWLQEPVLVQLRPTFAPIKANAAAALLLLAGVLLACELGFRRACWFALAPAALGALTLFQDLARHPLGIDQLLASNFLNTADLTPGRMAPAVSVSLLLVGLSIACLRIPRLARHRTLGLAIAGSIALSIGAATLLGYVLELRAVYRWGIGTNTAPLAAIALTVLGLAVLLFAWRENQQQEGRAPTWLPLPVVVGSATLTLILWVGLRQREIDYLGRTTEIAANSLATAISREIETQSNLIERIARRWAQADANETVWAVDASTHLAESAACTSVSLLDPDGITRWTHPSGARAVGRDSDHVDSEPRQRALESAPASDASAVSATLDLNDGSPGFGIYAPIHRRGDLWGFVAADYAYSNLFAELVVQRLKLTADYECQIEVGGRLSYDSTALAGMPLASAGRETIDKVFTIFDRRVRISLVSSEALLRRTRRFLPELALAAGFGITLLMGLSVHLARTAYTSLRKAELSNRRLQAENEERRRAEGMLKVSDERLNLALDSTQIGIFEWNVRGNHVHYSPGMWAMLGYEPGQIGTQVESWMALIHPDDLPIYREAIERQRSGEAIFVEPEYRVRTGSGQWRWLYARAKTVKRTGNGSPARVIGTLQDITARKRAEAALRESQAATRKLSLVASRTDNLVIIGTPHGTIEWVNESFTRVVEYTLDDVRGRNPAELMGGPETSARTALRIAAAMKRGVGITSDVVIYSKSGRKYHVHLEVQPIRNESGAIETFIAMLADITPRVETEHALRRAKSEADAASRAKSEFLAAMSHEIRTPMNGVIGMTSLLLETGLDPEQRDFVNTIRTSGESLLAIINDILDFSKIESGKMDLERLPFDLQTCVEDALDLLASQAAAKRLELAYYIEEDVPARVEGDLTRLRQILVNLVNNAVKFTPSGSITVTVRRLPPAHSPAPPDHLMLEFAVTDTGIGIPSDGVSRLFKPFSQIDSSTTRKYGGTGLGLAICHRLTHLMGGGIRVESEPEKGSRFIFTLSTRALSPSVSASRATLDLLQGRAVIGMEDNEVAQRWLGTFFTRCGARYVPVHTPAEALAALVRQPQPGLVVFDHDLIDSPRGRELAGLIEAQKVPTIFLLSPGQSSSQPPGQQPHVLPLNKPVKAATLLRTVRQALPTGDRAAITSVTAVKPRTLAAQIPLEVLLVEDNAVNQKVALRFLAQLGYHVEAVSNGLEAVAAVEAGTFDLVLMDLQMPELDGLEASRRIRARLPAGRQPKIVALTANALLGDRELCLAAGMDDYLTKPIKPKELNDVIRRQFSPPSIPGSYLQT